MGMMIEIKHWWQNLVSGGKYVNLLTRVREGNEYYDNIEWILKSDLPMDAKNIRNYGKIWYYREENMCPDDNDVADRSMNAIALKRWADNNSWDKSLAGVWSWANNINWKKIGIAIAVIVLAGFALVMVKP